MSQFCDNSGQGVPLSVLIRGEGVSYYKKLHANQNTDSPKLTTTQNDTTQLDTPSDPKIIETTDKSAQGQAASITVTIDRGGSQSLSIRELINEMPESKDLNPSQKAYLENRLTSAIGSIDQVVEGQSFAIDPKHLESYLTKSKQMSDNDQAAWLPFAQ